MLREHPGGALQRWLGSRRPHQRAGRPWLDADTRAVLDACPDAVIGVDDEGACILANAVAEQVFGRREADLVGAPAMQLLPELAAVIRDIVTRRRTGQTAPGTAGPAVETVARRPDGTMLPVEVWISPAYSRSRPLSLYATVRTLTDRNAAHAARQALLGEVATLRDTVTAVTGALRDRAVVLTDPDGHITSLNRAAEKLLGYRSEDIVGKPTTALSHPDDVDAVRAELRLPSGVDPLLEITRSGLPNQQRWRMLTRDGDVRPVTLLITAIGDHGDPSGFVMVLSPRRSEWEPLVAPRSSSDRLLLDLDDAETRTLRWQVGGAASRRR